MYRFFVLWKAIGQLGLRPVLLNALYRLGLVSGYYRRVRPEAALRGWLPTPLRPLFDLPRREALEALLDEAGRAALLAEADEIVAGKVRLFGAQPCPLVLDLPGARAHWVDYERGKAPLPFSLLADLPAPDIKFLWEPARFGWVFALGRAYHVAGDERYAEAFWRYTETFLQANPPYLGPHWMSAQEVALRLLAFVWAGQVFAASPATTLARQRRLAEAVAVHAARIPPTLVYARSQGNNHLLSEAAALFTAALALPAHPQAGRWRALGWRWFNNGLQTQIDGSGEYSQHSTNYHRLMLQLALWMNMLLKPAGVSWPWQSLLALRRATHWLLALIDPDSGQAPNLGANDGAYLFPLTVCPFADFRPPAWAAARAFLDYDLPHGVWDEMSLWFAVNMDAPRRLTLTRYPGDQLYGRDSWGYLRTAQFTSRPSHADQLHVDLWWRGVNLAQDAGTYLYNAPPPWENSLTAAEVHNTVTVNGRDHFRRVGRFLYLDWFDAYRREVLVNEADVLQRVLGRYRHDRQGYRHTRTVTVFADGRWQVEDELLPLSPWMSASRRYVFRLHWLFPDCPWELVQEPTGVILRLTMLPGVATIRAHCQQPPGAAVGCSLARAGALLAGSGEVAVYRGWVSPTYGVRLPALSLALVVEHDSAVVFMTEFILDDHKYLDP